MSTDTQDSYNGRDVLPEIEITRASSQETVIFVGNKPLMNYVTGVVMQFTKKNALAVTIKARGKFIAKAVDIAEVARRRFLASNNVQAKEINIGTEEYDREGKKISVSTIEILLGKQQ